MRFVTGVLGVLATLTSPLAQAQTRPDTNSVLAGQQMAPATIQPQTPETTVESLPQTSATFSAEPGFSNGTLIGGVNIEGGDKLPASEFSSIIETYLGKSADGASLQQLARSVASLARERGYLFASAIVPEQEINFGIVRVKLDEGRIDEVRINGVQNQRFRRILGILAGSAAVKAVLERQLLLAGEIPGISILRTRFERDHGRGILIIDAKEDRAKGQIALDNFGSNSLGPIRARAQADLTSLIVEGDSLTTQLLGTPTSVNELTYASARYAVPVGDDGFTLAVSLGAGRTQVPSFASAQNINGRSNFASVSALYPAIRSNSHSVWISGEVAYLTVDQAALGVTLQQDTVVTASLSVNGQIRLGGGRLNGGIGYVQGLGILGATGNRDPLSSRFDGDGKFRKSYAWLQWTAGLGHKLSVRVAATGQIASRPLLAAQELNLGGPGFGRGFNFSERFGDEGVAGSIELRRDFNEPLPHVNWAQLYGFTDAGYVHNLQNGFGSGSLYSAGGGIRAKIGPTELSLEAAMPINVIRAESGDKDPRVNVSFGYRF
jgi:hemolysin activation/secretion protein